MATHSGILAWRLPTDRGKWQATVHGVAKSQPRLSDSTQHKGRGLPCALAGSWKGSLRERRAGAQS